MISSERNFSLINRLPNLSQSILLLQLCSSDTRKHLLHARCLKLDLDSLLVSVGTEVPESISLLPSP